jgi:hypothetical protein
MALHDLDRALPIDPALLQRGEIPLIRRSCSAEIPLIWLCSAEM